MKKKVISMLNSMVKVTVKQSIHSVCFFIHYQPELPEGLKREQDIKREKYNV